MCAGINLAIHPHPRPTSAPPMSSSAPPPILPHNSPALPFHTTAPTVYLSPCPHTYPSNQPTHLATFSLPRPFSRYSSRFATAIAPPTTARMPARRRRKEGHQLSPRRERCWFQYQCMSRTGYPHQYQGWLSPGRFIYLQNGSDGVGEAVEGLAGVFQAENAELVESTFEIVEAEWEGRRKRTCGCCCSRWRGAASWASRTRGWGGPGRREAPIADLQNRRQGNLGRHHRRRAGSEGEGEA